MGLISWIILGLIAGYLAHTSDRATAARAS